MSNKIKFKQLLSMVGLIVVLILMGCGFYYAVLQLKLNSEKSAQGQDADQLPSLDSITNP